MPNKALIVNKLWRFSLKAKKNQETIRIIVIIIEQVFQTMRVMDHTTKNI